MTRSRPVHHEVFARARHLAGRFFSSLRRREPSAAALDEVRAVLNAGEWACWCELGRADRVEAIATKDRLPPDVAADERWVAAALVHDVGKAVCGLGVFGRCLATVRGWVQSPEKVRGRAGLYLRHAELGAARLQAAGARPEAVAWASAHHDPARWPVELIPREVCVALARADGEAV